MKPEIWILIAVLTLFCISLFISNYSEKIKAEIKKNKERSKTTGTVIKIIYDKRNRDKQEVSIIKIEDDNDDEEYLFVAILKKNFKDLYKEQRVEIVFDTTTPILKSTNEASRSEYKDGTVEFTEEITYVWRLVSYKVIDGQLELFIQHEDGMFIPFTEDEAAVA